MESRWTTPQALFMSLNEKFNFEVPLLSLAIGWIGQDWDSIAEVITRVDVRDWLIEQAQQLPTKHIGNYMHRYLLCDNKIYSSARINHIMREDLDPFVHDHPFDWRTIILRGWYIEEDIFGNFHRREAGYTAANQAETFHRIHEVSPGGVWTLFITGPRYVNRIERNHWGFLVSDNGAPPRKVAHEVYHSANGRAA